MIIAPIFVAHYCFKIKVRCHGKYKFTLLIKSDGYSVQYAHNQLIYPKIYCISVSNRDNPQNSGVVQADKCYGISSFVLSNAAGVLPGLTTFPTIPLPLTLLYRTLPLYTVRLFTIRKTYDLQTARSLFPDRVPITQPAPSLVGGVYTERSRGSSVYVYRKWANF